MTVRKEVKMIHLKKSTYELLMSKHYTVTLSDVYKHQLGSNTAESSLRFPINIEYYTQRFGSNEV